MFNPSNKQKIEALEYCIDSFKDYLDAFTDEFKEFKREIRNDFFDLKCKHEEAVEAGGLAVEQMRYDIGHLKNRYEQLDKWDDETRRKFTAIMNYLNAGFKEGLRVVDNEECSEEV